MTLPMPEGGRGGAGAGGGGGSSGGGGGGFANSSTAYRMLGAHGGGSGKMVMDVGVQCAPASPRKTRRRKTFADGKGGNGKGGKGGKKGNCGGGGDGGDVWARQLRCANPDSAMNTTKALSISYDCIMKKMIQDRFDDNRGKARESMALFVSHYLLDAFGMREYT